MLTPLSSGWPFDSNTGGEHLDRFFRYPPMVFGDQHDELGAWPLMVMFSPGGHGLVEHPQAIAGSVASPAALPTRRSCLQHDPLHQWRSVGRSFCPRAGRTAFHDHHVVNSRRAVDHCATSLTQPVAAVLQRPGRPAACGAPPVWNGRPLAQADRMAYEEHRTAGRCRRCRWCRRRPRRRRGRRLTAVTTLPITAVSLKK